MSSKVVVTKMAGVTPIGNSENEITYNLYHGVSGIDKITRFETSDFAIKHAAESNINCIIQDKDYNLETYQWQIVDYTLRDILPSICKKYKSTEIGAIIGVDPNIATKENLEKLLLEYKTGTNQRTEIRQQLFHTNPVSLLYYLAKKYEIQGPCLANLETCAASTQAIGEAYKMIERGEVEAMLVGGFSFKIEPTTIARLERLGALEKTKENIAENCRPFDNNRSGFTIGDGAVFFVLEKDENVDLQKENVLCSIKGYGSALDGYSMTDPHVDALGMTLAMERALEDAAMQREEIDYINAHGTGTIKNDLYETVAIKNVFKSYSKKLKISSTKSMHGHLLPASGAMGMMCSIIAMQNGFFPPTINYHEKDAKCDLDYVPNIRETGNIKNAMINSFGLGGQNATIIVGKE